MQTAGDYSLDLWTGFFGDADENNDSISVVITSLATPLIELGPDVVVCDELVLDAGNDGALYEWNTDEGTEEITVTESGIYGVVITNLFTLCTASDSLYVTVENFPVAGFEYSMDGEIVTFTNVSDGGTSYSWNLGDGFGSSESDPVHDYGEGGTYIVTFYVTNTCGTDTFIDTLVVEDVPDFIDVIPGNNISIYPNPSNGLVNINFGNSGNEVVHLKLYNYTGQMVYHNDRVAKGGELFELNVSEFLPGIYYVQIEASDLIYRERLVIVE
jgi:hypothetical protein